MWGVKMDEIEDEISDDVSDGMQFHSPFNQKKHNLQNYIPMHYAPHTSITKQASSTYAYSEG